MDLRAGRSQASEAPAPAPAREPRDPLPSLPGPRAGPGGRRGCPRLQGSGRGGTAGALKRGRAGTRHSCSPVGGPGGGRERGGEPGEPQIWGAATWSPSEAGSRGSRRTESRAKAGRASPRRGAGLRGEGAGRGRGRAGGRRGSPRPGRREAGEADTSGRAALPPRPPGGWAGRRAGERREEGGGQSRPGRAAGLAAPSLRAARPEPTMLPAAAEPAAGDSWGMLACLCTVLWHLPAVPALNRTGDPGPGPSIQKTYDLTRYLEHQLRSLAGTYLNYLGPPFNEPDFNPPRLGAETLPRATVNLDVWQNLSDKLRLTQNYEAYSHLLCYLRGLNRQAATAELRRSLAHFCTSLQGLLGSIAGVMAALGYPLPQPLPGTEPTWSPDPAHSDFLQKMDDFWLLKELQTWLWRSAKDFNRLKKKMQPPAAAVTLRLEAHGF
ncbi:cardiotrophin-like cytokine factor 1 isoform X1 [Equus asinus]|uniref:cardiotrophin-like cytokine factor 1 isoform X1 n=1 Tax=Equus asinus TaxID=9793 RepID=UPI0038F7999B